MKLGHWCKFHITMTLSSRVKDIKDLTSTANKMKFSIKEFFIKCEKIHSFMWDLFTFAEEILNGKLQFLCNHGAMQNPEKD